MEAGRPTAGPRATRGNGRPAAFRLSHIRTRLDLVQSFGGLLMLLWTRLKSRAAANPDKLAVICGHTRLTYAQFVDQAEHLAHAWLRQGLRPGDRIALHLRNSIELATCYYACFAGGFVAVPVNTRLTPEEINYVLEHSGARAYLAQTDLRISTSIPSWEYQIAKEISGSLPVPDPDDPAML